MIRKATSQILKDYKFEDAGEVIDWKPGQLEIIDCILHRKSPDGKNRVEIIAATRYGKSLAVAAGVVIRASLKPEKWAIVAGMILFSFPLFILFQILAWLEPKKEN